MAPTLFTACNTLPPEGAELRLGRLCASFGGLLVVSAAGVGAAVFEQISRVGQVALRATRLNKACFMAFSHVLSAQEAIYLIANVYVYPATRAHRESVTVVMEKRPPRFNL